MNTLLRLSVVFLAGSLVVSALDVQFPLNDCLFGGPDCSQTCKDNHCSSGTGQCVGNTHCSCSGCNNCFPSNDCLFNIGDSRCKSTCEQNGCTGSYKECFGNSVCCCSGCSGSK